MTICGSARVVFSRLGINERKRPDLDSKSTSELPHRARCASESISSKLLLRRFQALMDYNAIARQADGRDDFVVIGQGEAAFLVPKRGQEIGQVPGE